MQKRIAIIIEKIAKKNNLPIPVVEQIYRSVFISVRKGLLRFKNVRLINIGQFVARKHMLEGDTPLARKFKKDPRYGENQIEE